MALRHLILVPLFLLLLPSALTAGAAGQPAPEKPTPGQRLANATADSSLEAIDDKPWHAKLAVTLFDSKGKNPTDATVEYWKSGAETLRVITMGASSETLLKHDGKQYGGSTGAALPDLATAVFEAFLHPGPSSSDLDDATPDVRRQKFGKITLDCIMLTHPIKRLAYAPLGLFPTYCIQTDTDRLLVTYDFGSRGVIINRSGHFLDHDVPVEFSVTEGAATVATSRIVSMGTFVPTPATFLPSPQLTPLIKDQARISSGIVAGLKTGGTPPSYPEQARANRVSGTVILRAIIGTDGHIHSLQVKSAPDPDLALAALVAVRTWTYRPYLLQGVPVQVDTIIVVNFNL